MRLLEQGFFEEKKSKFYSYLFELDNSNEYKEVLDYVKKLHKKANHHCFALVFDDFEKMSNDSEVGSPGRIIQDHIKRCEHKKHIVVVSRIFGGVKLGPGGVGRAFRKSLQNLE